MTKVLKECDKVEKDFDPDAIHDLRTALRRCRTIADGLKQLDSDHNWRKLKKISKKLFHEMGELRDKQIIREWVQKLAPESDPFRAKLLQSIAEDEQHFRSAARKALDAFDRKAWRKLCHVLPERLRKVPKEGLAFQHLALETWNEANSLHRLALRRKSSLAWHRLRIGLKHFRYNIENFLPKRYEEWGADLKKLQDLLGDVHDLDVLWQELRAIGISADVESAKKWKSWIDSERGARIAAYHSMMTGRESLWPVWRAGLPNGGRLEAAALAKLSTWASFLDLDFAHTQRVRQIALALFDGFRSMGIDQVFRDNRGRRILECAALLHDVGHSKQTAGHHKASYWMIRDLPPPIGWTEEDMLWTALVARYHRGAEPRGTHQGFGALSPIEQQKVAWLAGVVRLADGLDGKHDGRVLGVTVQLTREAIHVYAKGYSEDMALKARVAEKKHLLEVLSGRPVILRPAEARPELLRNPALAS